MRLLLAAFVLLAIAGGVGYGLLKAGMLPYGKKAAAKQASEPTQAVAHAEETPQAPSSEDASIIPKTRPALPPTARVEDAREAEKRIRRMAAVYDGMPADAVAPIMERLPAALVRDLLRRMDEGQVGKVLLAMKPERAALITRELVSAQAAPVASR